MKTSTSITVLGAALGVGAGKQGCEQAPELLVTSPLLHDCHLPLRFATIHKNEQTNVHGMAAMSAIAAFDTALAKDTAEAVANNKPFLVFGGDQSISVGTWSGAASSCHARGESLGLIWIDAHMDSHTPDTTESGNIHGMPLAALMGLGDRQLTQCYQPQVKLKPEKVCLIGIRSYEAGEADLLEHLGVRIFFIEEVRLRGIQAILLEARQHVTCYAQSFGISIDLDGLSPLDAPGVGTPVEPGIPLKEFLPALHECAQSPQFIGAEIVEFNPSLDVDQKTEHCVAQVVQALYGEKR